MRVSVEAYPAFVGLVFKLGELVNIKADSQDMSEEYSSLDARQANKKVEGDSPLKHRSDSIGKVDEIHAVEREPSRVRCEIEKMQSRLKVLTDLASQATVKVASPEFKDHVPVRAPILGTKLGRTFSRSIDVIRQFGEAALACSSWMPSYPGRLPLRQV